MPREEIVEFLIGSKAFIQPINLVEFIIDAEEKSRYFASRS